MGRNKKSEGEKQVSEMHRWHPQLYRDLKLFHSQVSKESWNQFIEIILWDYYHKLKSGMELTIPVSLVKKQKNERLTRNKQGL